MIEPIEAQNNIVIDLHIVVEPIKAQNNIRLPIVVEPIEAQNNIELRSHCGRTCWGKKYHWSAHYGKK